MLNQGLNPFIKKMKKLKLNKKTICSFLSKGSPMAPSFECPHTSPNEAGASCWCEIDGDEDSCEC